MTLPTPRLAPPWLVLGAALAVGCHEDAPAAPAEVADPLASLRAFEEERRARADFEHLPTWDAATGSNPIDLARLPGTSRFVGILRGRDAVVVLDAGLREVARLAAPASPTGLAIGADGSVYVSGEASSAIARYRVRGGELARDGSIDLPGALAIRDLAAGPEGLLYLVEEHDGRLLTIDPARPVVAPPASDGPPGCCAPPSRFAAAAAPPHAAPTCNGPIAVARVGSRVIVDCLLDHALVVRKVDAHGWPLKEGESRIQHDGPIWSFDARPVPGGLLVAAGGVEDHPLDRAEGSFGFIDSFVFLYRVPDDGGAPVLLRSVNVSELGVVTPKWLHLQPSPDGGATVTTAGYAGDTLATLHLPADPAAPVATEARPLVPGTTAAVATDGGWLLADPLLDAWVALRGGAPDVVAVADDRPRSSDARVGEALFFTTLMAPWNKTEGRLSRFTCETCHFEGYVDGRTHHTGRGDVRATTKPLVGLFNNRPHFSRALDPDLASVAENEFVVAGAKSEHDPSFAIEAASRPWLASLGAEGTLSPEALRRSLMAFLMDLNHRPSPKAQGRAAFSDEERAGAAAFQARCEGCHEARLVADDAGTRAPFARWEGLVLAKEGPIVWGKDAYARTGVVPYVHDEGARVPSLRRLYKKRPYFTNGGASDLRDVLDAVRLRGPEATHAGAPEGDGWEALGEPEKRAMRAFLDLL